MRYKEHTITKIDGQVSKLKTLQRMIEMKTLSGPDAIQFIEGVIKELNLVVGRLELEPNE